LVPEIVIASIGTYLAKRRLFCAAARNAF